ncbi:unnamed protein product [Paramecium octaurelia]|uniref:Uncharacterized protein n=1 Tax=Paramecium octaurelia TaxID=43137 RepID=A0A8S1WFS5_PAROT|nr:unnamed protein product [Paramecium octaurelia]
MYTNIELEKNDKKINLNAIILKDHPNFIEITTLIRLQSLINSNRKKPV